MRQFLSILMSETGPITNIEKDLFQEILTFLSIDGRDRPKLQQRAKEDDSKTENGYGSVNDFLKEESLVDFDTKDILGWDESFNDSHLDENDEIFRPKINKAKPKKVKSKQNGKNKTVLGMYFSSTP